MLLQPLLFPSLLLWCHLFLYYCCYLSIIQTMRKFNRREENIAPLIIFKHQPTLWKRVWRLFFNEEPEETSKINQSFLLKPPSVFVQGMIVYCTTHQVSKQSISSPTVLSSLVHYSSSKDWNDHWQERAYFLSVGHMMFLYYQLTF